MDQIPVRKPTQKRALSKRSQIAPFIVMDVMTAAAEREAQGRDVIHMEVGQPGTPAPRLALEAAANAMKSETLGYTVALGIPELRERIARHYAEQYNLSVPTERIVVTAGSSAAFVLSFLALFDPGMRVALPSPGYPCYRHILTSLDIEPVIIETSETHRWMPSVGDLDTVGRLDGLLLASPANPTGTMLTGDRVRELTEGCDQRGIWFISDEIYHGLTYAEDAKSALAFSDQVVVINSFSKYFSMTGWRIGWMVVPDQMVRAVERLAQNLYISPTTISQYAALAAFEAREELEQHREVYAKNRELLLDALPDIGFKNILPADGAFYLYADVADFTNDSKSFARRLLDEAGVAITPGLDFDERRGNQFVRFSYAGTTSDMEAAVKRLRSWFQKFRS